jgi:hypothetical protein
MTTVSKVPTRGLEVDLAICEAATPGPWKVPLDGVIVRDYWEIDGSRQIICNVMTTAADAHFASQARDGWPYAIRRALEAEAEIDRLRNELNILQEQLEVCGVDASTC